jgi:surfactin synthase thioesterase subunit
MQVVAERVSEASNCVLGGILGAMITYEVYIAYDKQHVYVVLVADSGCTRRKRKIHADRRQSLTLVEAL